jgi:poly [ADP-ribose] polymerase 10/14/15
LCSIPNIDVGNYLLKIYCKKSIFLLFTLQKLEEFVSSCFSHADSKQYTSIALPAIGTGNLGYNKNKVAATMFKAAKKFFRDHHPSALRRVLFVVYGQDIECLKVVNC